MSKISLLPIEEAKKIAAGEVIERPANAFKELVENSIDAGANNISIYLDESGKKLIQIIDDGCGMSEVDARLCIEQHATSKIRSIDDLQSIETFGFRGEALSAITSVSLINLTTKEAKSPIGISLDIENGSIIKQSPVSCNTGTNITIKDLFYNVPARKKFLKSKETEWRAIVQIFNAFCLNYPNIGFKLFHKDKLIYNCPAVSKIEAKLRQIYELSLIENILLLDISDDKTSLKINGALSNPNYSRYDRNQIFLFVNKRWVKNYKLVQSIIKGYQNILQPGKYPAAFIFISIDPKQVDINIHPRKEEIQFLYPRVIENLLESSIKLRLEEYLSFGLGKKEIQNIKPNNSINSPKTNSFFYSISDTKEKDINLKEDNAAQKILQDFTSHLLQTNLTTSESNKMSVKEISSETDFLSILSNSAQKESQISLVNESQEFLFDYKLIGQIFLTYLIIQTDNNITIIDQHAAHERVIYERLKRQFETIAKIKLIFPQVINLIEDDLKTLNEYLSLFLPFGIVIEQISKNQLIILETPIFLKNQSLDDIVKEAISLLNDNKCLEPEVLKKILMEKIHCQLSCKSAIKAGQELNTETINQLIKEFYTTNNRLTCPHGRPTTWILTKSEIEKKFKRDYR